MRKVKKKKKSSTSHFTEGGNFTEKIEYDHVTEDYIIL